MSKTIGFCPDHRVEASVKNEHNDCVVRALQHALTMSYETAHSLFKEAGRRDGKRTSRDMVVKVYSKFGFEKNVQMTLRRFIDENPSGAFICVKWGHAFAVINGVVYDDRPQPGQTKLYHYWRMV